MYSKENKNLFNIHEANSIIKYLDDISNKAPNIKNIVIDDSTYILRTEFFDKVSERGFDKYNQLADNFRRIIQKANSLRGDLDVFMMIHSEPVETDGTIIGYKVSTVGKLLDKMYNPLESVSISLYAEPKFNENGVPEYGFYTHKQLIKGAELPCKTPEGMFEEDYIPNDLQYIKDKINSYFNE